MAVLASMDVPRIDAHPLELLAQITAEVRQWQLILRGMVADLESVTTTSEAGVQRIQPVIIAWQNASAQAAALAAEVARLDVAGHLAQISESQGLAMAAMIRAVLARLGHDPHDPAIGRVVAEELRLMAARHAAA